MPVLTVRVGFDADDHAVAVARHLRWHPLGGRLEGGGVNVGVDAASCEQDQVAEEVGFHDGGRKRLVGLEHLWDRSVEVADELQGDVVGDDFVDEGGVQDAPAGLVFAEFKLEVAGGRSGLPCLPDVCRELAVDIVREGVLQLEAEGLAAEVVERDLGLWLSGWLREFEGAGRDRGLEGGRLFTLSRGSFFVDGGRKRFGLGQLVGIVEAVLGVRRAQHEEQGQDDGGEHECSPVGEHDGLECWAETCGCNSTRGGWSGGVAGLGRE